MCSLELNATSQCARGLKMTVEPKGGEMETPQVSFSPLASLPPGYCIKNSLRRRADWQCP